MRFSVENSIFIIIKIYCWASKTKKSRFLMIFWTTKRRAPLPAPRIRKSRRQIDLSISICIPRGKLTQILISKVAVSLLVILQEHFDISFGKSIKKWSFLRPSVTHFKNFIYLLINAYCSSKLIVDILA
jgi:hypothetical protein